MLNVLFAPRSTAPFSSAPRRPSLPRALATAAGGSGKGWLKALSRSSASALFAVVCVIGTVCLIGTVPLQAADIEVPELGDASSAMISPQKEYELGQMVLKVYRNQMPTSTDPIIRSYLEELTTEIAAYSQLDDKSFDLLVIDNPAINAFAVPGRVIGVHNGIFLTAESEDQLASILAHELAHLSQRHYARQLEQQKNATLPTLAGLLAGIVLAAAGGGDAAMAAIGATQAVALEHRLRFSRSYEQEADRIGIQNLAASGRDPYAAGDMFEAMLKASRYTRRPPEFLSTHPVTESRIADARNRARNLARQTGAEKNESDNLAFHQIAARVKLRFANTPQVAVQRFRSELQGETLSEEASRYGLVLALTEVNQTKAAREELETLLAERPDNLLYHVALAEIEAKEKNYQNAIRILEDKLKTNPDNHPLTITLAEILMQSGRYDRCQQLLQQYVRQRPKDEYVWYLLAEVHGLVGNILEVHRARAEYFILVGVFDRAKNQLENARRLSKDDAITTAMVEQRLRDVNNMLVMAERFMR